MFAKVRGLRGDPQSSEQAPAKSCVEAARCAHMHGMQDQLTCTLSITMTGMQPCRTASSMRALQPSPAPAKTCGVLCIHDWVSHQVRVPDEEASLPLGYHAPSQGTATQTEHAPLPTGGHQAELGPGQPAGVVPRDLMVHAYEHLVLLPPALHVLCAYGVAGVLLA